MITRTTHDWRYQLVKVSQAILHRERSQERNQLTIDNGRHGRYLVVCWCFHQRFPCMLDPCNLIRTTWRANLIFSNFTNGQIILTGMKSMDPRPDKGLIIDGPGPWRKPTGLSHGCDFACPIPKSWAGLRAEPERSAPRWTSHALKSPVAEPHFFSDLQSLPAYVRWCDATHVLPIFYRIKNKPVKAN